MSLTSDFQDFVTGQVTLLPKPAPGEPAPHRTGGAKYDAGLLYQPDDAAPRTMSDGNLSELVTGAGWIHNNAEPVCIIKHESQGRTDATSKNPDGNENIGLFQIDTVNVTCGKCLKSAQYNAAVAHRMWVADRGFKKHWATASQCEGKTGNTPIGSEATPDNPVTSVATGISDSIGRLIPGITELLNGIPWFRLGKGTFGFLLLVGGSFAIIFIIANKAASSPAGKAVKTTAKRAAVIAAI